MEGDGERFSESEEKTGMMEDRVHIGRNTVWDRRPTSFLLK